MKFQSGWSRKDSLISGSLPLVSSRLHCSVCAPCVKAKSCRHVPHGHNSLTISQTMQANQGSESIFRYKSKCFVMDVVNKSWTDKGVGNISLYAGVGTRRPYLTLTTESVSQRHGLHKCGVFCGFRMISLWFSAGCSGRFCLWRNEIKGAGWCYRDFQSMLNFSMQLRVASVCSSWKCLHLQVF